MINLHDTTVIIPSYRAKKTIMTVIEKVQALSPHSIIVVDDNCPDGTYDIVKKKKIKNLFVIKLPKNKGVGGAFLSGVQLALNGSGSNEIEFFAKVDADDQHYPKDLRHLKWVIEHLDADYVKGNRFQLSATPKSMPMVRKIGNSGLTFLIKLSTGFWHVSDPVNGMIMGRKSVFIHLMKHKIEKRYLFENSMLLELSKIGAVVREAPNTIVYKNEVSSLHWGREILPFLKLNSKGFVQRISREYIFPQLNLGLIPLFVFLLSFVSVVVLTLIIIFGSLLSGTYTDQGILILFTISMIFGLMGLFVWLLFDSQLGRHKYPLYNILRIMNKEED